MLTAKAKPMYYVRELSLSEDPFSNYQLADGGNALRNLSTLNVFIGVNNSGMRWSKLGGRANL